MAPVYENDVQGDDQFDTTRSFEASIHASLIRKSHPTYKYDSEESSPDKTCGEQCWSFFNSTKFFLCTSHTLASWGNRMWTFAVGLFMIYLSQTSLRLTAVYGFVLGGAIMLFGPIMGDMVDTIPRLKYARSVLFIINSSIAISALIVCLTVQYNDTLLTMWNGWAVTACHCAIVFFSVLGNTASVGRMIAIERDWIVVMVKDKYELTSLSALLRRIDLVTNLIAPVVTGQLFTYGSIIMCAIFIAVWNVAFVFVEYGLLIIIYRRVPELALDKEIVRDDEEDEKEGEKTPLLGSNTIKSNKSTKSSLATSQRAKPKKKNSAKYIASRVFSVFIAFYKGWKVYVHEETLLAGLALGFTFMTVLGFDNVTTGFAISEGLNSSIFGILSGIGSLIGVLGTIAFPVARKQMGLLKTGMFAFCLQLFLLTPCVISIFAPGSVFQWDYLWAKPVPVSPVMTTLSPFINPATTPLPLISTTTPPAVVDLQTTADISLDIANMTDNSTTTTLLSTTTTTITTTTTTTMMPTTTTPLFVTNMTDPDNVAFPPPSSYLSVGLLMFGIMTSRCGLWMADLTVTQLLIETPKEHQRGIVNGVQNAINRGWDLTKFMIVVLLPWPQTFGYLILTTYTFISMACIFFTCFSFRARRLGYKVLSDEKEREAQEAKAADIEKQAAKQRMKNKKPKNNNNYNNKSNKYGSGDGQS